MKYTNLQRSAERRITVLSVASYDPGSHTNAIIRFQVSTGFGSPVIPETLDPVIIRIIGQDGSSAAFNPIVTPGFGSLLPLNELNRGAAASGVGPDRDWGEFAVLPNGQGIVEFQCNPHFGPPGVPVPGAVTIIMDGARVVIPIST